ncbi:hypothetical protein [Dactylosporangium sp. NPDC049140]|uniref:hypothetical protein n=1 Tax=Dactylosporangium sp. NPDC049140 TaxID=3155647 RepID=UPI0033DFEDEB
MLGLGGGPHPGQGRGRDGRVGRERAPVGAAQSHGAVGRQDVARRGACPFDADAGQQHRPPGVGEPVDPRPVARGVQRHARVMQRGAAAENHETPVRVEMRQLAGGVGMQLQHVAAGPPTPGLGVQDRRGEPCVPGRPEQGRVHCNPPSAVDAVIATIDGRLQDVRAAAAARSGRFDVPSGVESLQNQARR